MKRVSLIALLITTLAGYVATQMVSAEDKPKPTGELSKKYVLVTHHAAGNFRTQLVKRVEFRKQGGREFLVGDYCVNEKAGVDKEWEGVQLWVPVEGIDTMLVFSDEAKAIAVIEQNGTSKEKP